MRVVNRDYLIELVDEYYKQQQSNCFFCKDFFFCKKTSLLEEELRLKKLNTLNSDVVVWKISYYKSDPSILTIFPEHNDWCHFTEVKYANANNSIHATEPKKGELVLQVMICLQQKQRHCFHVELCCFTRVENGNSFWIFWKSLSKIMSS